MNEQLSMEPLGPPESPEPAQPSPSEFDGRVWAKAFIEHIKWKPSIATDEGTMLAWFASAIMAGYDEHARRYPTDRLIRAVARFNVAAKHDINPFRQRDEVIRAAFELAEPHVDPDAYESRS